jgi:hypothetical protein
MGKKLLGKNIDAKCVYCAYSVLTEDKTRVLCEKRGVTSLNDSCRKFVYDPLKREPQRPAKPQEFSSEDFKI